MAGLESVISGHSSAQYAINDRAVPPGPTHPYAIEPSARTLSVCGGEGVSGFVPASANEMRDSGRFLTTTLRHPACFDGARFFQNSYQASRIDNCVSEPVGMPPTLSGNAPPSFQNLQSPEMDVTRGAMVERGNVPEAARGGTVVLQKAGGQKKIDKQSLDYILKTGLAGGLAGCAVCALIPLLSTFN